MTRRIRANRSRTGIMRTRITPSRRSRSCRSIVWAVSSSSRRSRGGRYAATRARPLSKRARLRTSSPTARIRSSSRPRSTRTRLAGAIPPADRGRVGNSTCPGGGWYGSSSMPSSAQPRKSASAGAASRNWNRTPPGAGIGSAWTISPAVWSRPRTVVTLTPRAASAGVGMNVTRQARSPRNSAAFSRACFSSGSPSGGAGERGVSAPSRLTAGTGSNAATRAARAGCIRGRLPGAQDCDRSFEKTDPLKQDVYSPFGEWRITAPDGSQVGFQRLRRLLGGARPNHPREALDGMEGAEQAVELLAPRGGEVA